jgi:hypothetical protein
LKLDTRKHLGIRVPREKISIGFLKMQDPQRAGKEGKKAVNLALLKGFEGRGQRKVKGERE